MFQLPTLTPRRSWRKAVVWLSILLIGLLLTASLDQALAAEKVITTGAAQLEARLEISPATAAPGDIVQVTGVIHNWGDLPAPADQFHLVVADAATGRIAAEPATADVARLDDQRVSSGSVVIPAGGEYRFTTAVQVAADATEPVELRLEGVNRPVSAFGLIWLRGEESITIAAPEATPDEGVGGWTPRPSEPVPALFSGAATYTFPFETPPARAGIGPNLALSYDSRTSDGIVQYVDSNKYGEGWSLTGIPFVERENPIRCGWQNPEHELICFNGGYRLHLNGSYALVAEGSCGTNCSSYFVEDQPGWRALLYSGQAANEKGTHWIIRLPNGLEYRMGFYADSEQVLARACVTPETCGAHTYRWFLDQLSDPFNNRMVILYQSEKASGNYWHCSGSICREVDLWPIAIRYNNTVANPDRGGFPDTNGNWPVLTTWKAEIRFQWSNVNGPVTEATPYLRTRRALNEIAVRTRNEAGVWWDKWRYDINQREIPCPPGVGVYCSNTAVRRVVDSIQRTESTGAAWPAVTFEYVTHGVGCQVCSQTDPNYYVYQYPHLKRVHNGYGGVFEFDYASVNGSQGRTSWRVTAFKSWDGVDDVYGVDNPTRRQEFSYGTACFHQYSSGCYSGSGNESFILVGHSNTYVKTYEYDGATKILLSHDHYGWRTGLPLLNGKMSWHSTFSDEAATLPLHSVSYDWFYNDWQWADTGYVVCPRTQFTANWACMGFERHRYYEVEGNLSIFSHSTQTFYRYETGWTGNRQWGVLSRVEYYDQEWDGNLLRREGHFYVGNTSQDNWVLRKWSDVVWRDWGDIRQQALYLYGSNTDPNSQTIGRSDQLTWARQIVNTTEAPASGNFTYQTIDSQQSYGSWGLPEVSYSYLNYGQQQAVVTADWLPMSSADRAASRPSQVNETDYRDSGLLVSWVENDNNDRTTFSYGGATALYPWQLTSMTDATGQLVTYQYDSLGRLRYTFGPETNYSTDPSGEYRYNFFGGATAATQVVQIANPTFAGGQDFVSNGIRHHVRTDYDGLGRVINQRQIGVESTNTTTADKLVTVMTYDGLGRTICESIPLIRSSGDTVNPDACASNPHTSTSYDALGRPVSITGVDNRVTTIQYLTEGLPSWVSHGSLNGVRQEKTTTPDGSITYRTFDGEGQLVWIGEVESDSSCSNNARLHITRFTYDTVGNVTLVRRGATLCGSSYSTSSQISTSLSYDSAGRRLSLNDPDMGLWQYEYDPAGHIIRQVKDAAAITCAAFDNLGRLTDEWQVASGSCGAIPAQTASNFHAHYDYVLAGNGLGQIARVSWNPGLQAQGINGEFSDQFFYDSRNRMVRQIRTLNGQQFVSEILAFDRLNRPLSLRNPGGEIVTESYDFWGSDTLSVNGQALVTGTTHNYRGQPSRLDRGNGSYTTYGYWGSGRRYQLQNADTYLGNGTQIQDYYYDYDTVGRINVLNATVNGANDSWTYSYDSLGRLRTANPGDTSGSLTFSYDNLSNLVAVTGFLGSISYTAEPGYPHAVGTMTMAGNTYQFAYDEVGQMTHREGPAGSFDQDFDAFGNLSSVAEVGGETTYFAYDAAGQRVLTLHGDGSRTFTPFSGYEVEVAAGAVAEPSSTPTPTATATTPPTATATTPPTATATATATGTMPPTATATATTPPTATPTSTATAPTATATTPPTATATPGGGSGPDAPTNLTATNMRGQNRLRWAAVAGAASYNVYRSNSAEGPFNQIQSGLTFAAATDNGGSIGQYYYVTAVNGSGESAPSNVAQAFGLSSCWPNCLDAQMPILDDRPELAGAPEVAPEAPALLASVPAEVMGETGRVTDLTHVPQTITLSRNYQNPVVLAQPHSHNGEDSLIRITNVTGNSFTMFVHEAPDKDGSHTTETVSYLVVEAGRWQLADGRWLEAGLAWSGATLGAVPAGWQAVQYSLPFASTPALFTQVQSNNDPHWVTTRQQNSSGSGFAVALQEDDAQVAPHGLERIGWLAIEAGNGAWSGRNLSVGFTGDAVTHAWYTINFSPGQFTSAPRLLASMQTTDGGDSAHLRYRNLGANSVELEIEEDTTEDSEIDHTTENVAWLAIAGDGQLQAAPASTVRVSYSFGGQAVALRLIGSSAAEGLYYLHRDHLGSVVLQSNAAGAVVSDSRNRYLPFGGYREAATADISSRGYTDHQHNDDLGLIYMNARYYDPALRRFISADTIVPSPLSGKYYNRYSYVYNSPNNYVDPSGHCGQIAVNNGNEETLVRDTRDSACWDQYDELFNRFLTAGYKADWIVQRIGTGANYVFKDMNIVAIQDRYRNCGSDFDCSNDSPSTCGDGHGTYPCDAEERYRPCQFWQPCWEAERQTTHTEWQFFWKSGEEVSGPGPVAEPPEMVLCLIGCVAYGDKDFVEADGSEVNVTQWGTGMGIYLTIPVVDIDLGFYVLLRGATVTDEHGNRTTRPGMVFSLDLGDVNYSSSTVTNMEAEPLSSP